jgi:CheY-like chemotaxis protein
MVEKSTIRIMVLDDEPFMLKLLARMLTNLGITRVTTCDSGRIALESFESPNTPPDLILLDLNMPEMDGIEFVRHLVEQLYTGSLILISGENERMLQTVEKLVRAHKISVLGHLHKPIKPEGLSTLLERWTPHSLGNSGAVKKVYGAAEVRAAIDNGELVNYYQPKVVVATGEVVGVEALVRWCHPQDGMVFPDQFISVAEAHGLIDDLTRVVLANALAQVKAWKEAGLTLRMAVNVSMDNLLSQQTKS